MRRSADDFEYVGARLAHFYASKGDWLGRQSERLMRECFFAESLEAEEAQESAERSLLPHPTRDQGCFRLRNSIRWRSLADS